MLKCVPARVLGILASLLLAACSGAAPTAPEAVAACDRACLEAQLQQLLDAMIAHDPSGLAVSDNFVYVENNQIVRPGEGSWQTLQAIGNYRHYFADPETGQAALITTMRENNEAGVLTVRIKSEGGRLSEAELVLSHDPHGAANYESLGKPADEWLQAVPEDEQLSREALTALVNKYFGALENNDGKGDYSFFGDDCDRLEQGAVTTNTKPAALGYLTDKSFVTLDCRGQFETGLLGFVSRIRDRRYEVIDVERQAVFAQATYDHDGTTRSIAQTNGRSFKLPSYYSAARSLLVAEAFRVRDGHIQDLEQTHQEVPYGQRSALRSTFEPSSAVPGGRDAPLGKICERDCLEQALEQLLSAMVAHKPQNAPLAGLVSYVENDQALAIGDGLWGTLTGIASWQLRLSDANQHTAVFMGRVVETDLNSLLTLRIKLQGDRIQQIEAQLVREEKPGAEELFRRLQPSDPQPTALTRLDPTLLQVLAPEQQLDGKALVAVAQSYFDAVEGHSNLAPNFSADCSRHDNGLLVTNNPALPAPTRPQSAGALVWRVEAQGSGNVSAEFKPYALPCAAQLASGYASAVAAVRDRRVLLSDVERGLVLMAAYYDIPGTRQAYSSADGIRVHMPQVWGQPRTLATRQLFKIEGGAIRRIESFTRVLAYGSRPLLPPPAFSLPAAP